MSRRPRSVSSTSAAGRCTAMGWSTARRVGVGVDAAPWKRTTQDGKRIPGRLAGNNRLAWRRLYATAAMRFQARGILKLLTVMACGVDSPRGYKKTVTQKNRARTNGEA